MTHRLRPAVWLAISAALAGVTADAATRFYPGVIKREFFDDLGGTAITALTGAPKFQQNRPDEVDFVTQLESPPTSPDRNNYGGRLSGFIIPTETATYRLYVAGDDQTVLYLSTDDSPGNLREIAREPQWNGSRAFAESTNGDAGARPGCTDFDDTTDCENESDPIQLTQGQRYYFEVLWKEGSGGDHAAVAWVRDGELVVNGQEPIPAENLGVETSDEVEILGDPVASPTYGYTGDTIRLSASLYVPPDEEAGVQWLKDGEPIPGATAGSIDYVLTAGDAGKDLAFRVRLGTLESAEVVVKAIAPEPEVLSPGFVKVEYFHDVGSGGTVFDLLADPKYSENRPDAVEVRNSLSTRPNYANNFGARITGVIIPQVSGDYRFFVRSDDSSQFFLNTTPGGPTPDPFADYPIAEEPACCNPFQEPEAFSAATSEPISLAAGEEYAFLVLMKDGGGDDYFYAAWRREGDTTPAASLPALAGPVIGAEVQAAGFEVAITRQPQAPSDTVEEGRSITLAAETEAGPNPDFLLYQWQLDGEDIPGANAASYTTPPDLPVGSYTYRLVAMTVGNRSVTSDPITIEVVPDTFPPRPTAGVLRRDGALRVGIGFDEPVAEGAPADESNYSVSPGSIAEFRFIPQAGRAELTIEGVGEGEEVTVTVRNVEDLKGNAIPESGESLTVVLATRFSMAAVGGDEVNERTGTTNYPDDAIALGEGDFDLVSGGSAHWTSYDEQTFVYEEITGDFDRKVRVEYQDPTSQWARAGLQVREALDEGVTRQQLFRPDDTTDPLGPNPDGVKMSQSFTIRVNPVSGAVDPDTGTAIPGNNSYEIIHRPRAGYDYDGFNAMFAIQDGFGGAPPYPNAWMRIQREGQTLRAWKSEDGQNWGSPAFVTYQDDPGTPEDESLADTLYVGVFYAPEYFNNNIIPEGGPYILEGSSVARFREYGPVGDDPEPPPGLELEVSIADGGIEIRWPAGETATLESAPAVEGPWDTVPDATNPYEAPATGEARFFRLRQ